MAADGGNVVLVAPALGADAVLDSVESSSLDDDSPLSVPPRWPFCVASSSCGLCRLAGEPDDGGCG